jgi:hypothetical protein
MGDSVHLGFANLRAHLSVVSRNKTQSNLRFIASPDEEWEGINVSEFRFDIGHHASES